MFQLFCYTENHSEITSANIYLFAFVFFKSFFVRIFDVLDIAHLCNTFNSFRKKTCKLLSFIAARKLEKF